MNKFLTITISSAFMLALSVSSQAQKKPGFTFDEKTTTALNFTPQQKEKFQEIKTNYSVEAKKMQTEGNQLQVSFDKKSDSLLTSDQKQKVAELKEAINKQNKENPALRKTFNFDKATMDGLGLSADVQQKMTKLSATSQVEKWKHSQKWNKLFKDNADLQEAVLTPAQKQQADQMRAAIIEYNKTAQ